MEVKSWKMKVRSWKMEVRSWKLEDATLRFHKFHIDKLNKYSSNYYLQKIPSFETWDFS